MKNAAITERTPVADDRVRVSGQRLIRTPGSLRAAPHLLGLVLGGLLLVRALEAEGNPDDRALFVTNCAPCHGLDGRARTPVAKKLKVKDLTLSTLEDREIVEQILNGRRDKRKGMTMPAFRDRLTPEQVQALVETVKAFRKPRGTTRAVAP